MATNMLRPAQLSYRVHSWGECIAGSAAQLRALGIGEYERFPGEDGGPKRALNTRDPRGFEVKVTRCYAWEKYEYEAFVYFLGRKQMRELCSFKQVTFSPGVMLRRCIWTDDYTGTAAALLDAGLVQPGQFPGDAGMRKTVVRIYADGQVLSGPPTSNHADSKAPGARRIARTGAETFCVSVYVNEETASGRRRDDERELKLAELTMRLLPRPSRLDAAGSHISARRAAAARAAADPAFQLFLSKLAR